MKCSKPVQLVAVSALFATLVLFSCKKLNESTELGADLLPAIDNITTFETFLEVETDNFPFLDDSTYIPVAEDYALGVIQDPVFGKTTAKSYFAINAPTFPSYPFRNKNIDSVQIDSIVLSLKYTRTYGDTNSVQSFQAFEIDHNADFDTSVFNISHPDFTVSNALSNPVSVDFKTLNDSIRIIRGSDTVFTSNQLRIPLDNSLFARFQSYDSINAGPYSKDSLFWEVFRGIALLPAGGDNRAMAYFDLTNAECGINFYCRIRQNGVTDTTNVLFPVYAGTYSTGTGVLSFGRSANLIQRDISGKPYEMNLGTPPATANKELLYIQSTPGSYATVKIPGLDTLPNSVINLAELQINAVPTVDDNIFTKPLYLFLDIIDSGRNVVRTVKKDFSLDQNTQLPISTFGGQFNNQKSFFRITRYAQDVVSKKDSLYTLRLYAPYSTDPLITLPNDQLISFRQYYGVLSLPLNYPIAAGRVVLAGGAYADPGKKMRLRVVYSKL